MSPPVFLSGPAVVLLTNAAGFSARVEFETGSSTGGARKLSGRLFGRGTHLMFAPLNSDTSFLWDARQGGGQVLNGPMQGYAPIGPFAQPAGGVAGLEMAGSERVNGEECRKKEVTLASPDGATNRFAVWQPETGEGPPVRIVSEEADARWTLDLFEVEPARLGDDFFSPPEGFTRYPSAAAMLDELMQRRSAARRGGCAGPWNRFRPGITAAGDGRREGIEAVAARCDCNLLRVRRTGQSVDGSKTSRGAVKVRRATPRPSPAGSFHYAERPQFFGIGFQPGVDFGPLRSLVVD